MAGWYRQGTVALTPGSAAVTGAGTMWMGVVRPGSAFTTDGRTLYEIREVANDHTLTLDRPWEGETAAASAYAVIAASATLSNAELAGEIAAMVAKWAVREDQYDDWLGGSPNGGPNGDGKYPLTDSKGVTRLVESPARLLQLLDDGVVEHAAQIIAAIEDDVAAARQAATEATAAMTAVSADRQAVAQAAATVAAQAGESTAAAATATAQAAIAVQRAGEAAGSAAAAAGLEASATAALSAVETARDIVLEARTEAGTAASGALSSRTAAEAARDTATAARDAALEARDAAETARTQAQDWAVKTDAPVSGSLKSALSYALDAASQATSAAGKAMEAAGSAAAAAVSAADLDTAAADAQAAAGDAVTGAQTANAKAAAAALSADIARSAAQQAETAGAGSATARTAAEAARDSAATAMTAAQVAASQAGQSQTNAANSAQTAATAAADAISAKSDATSARDLAVAARTEAQGARDLAQAFAQGAVGYQPSPGVYSAFHWSEQAKGHAQTAATIVGGSNFGIVGDGTSQRFAADSPGSLLNLVQAPGGKLTFNPGSRAVSFGFDAVTAPVAPSGGITAGTVQGALEEIDHRLSTLSQDSIANSGGSVRVTEDGAVEIVPAAGQPATYRGGELHTSATAYGKAETDATIAAMVTAGQAAGAAKLTMPRTIALSGGVTGTATAFDGTANIAIPVTAIDAAKIVGTIPLGSMPAAALERLAVVSSQTARYALTTATVQVGDVVKETDTGKMFYLKDETNIGNSAGWEEYSVGTAALANSVPWTGVTGRPALLDAVAALDSSTGLVLQTSANTISKRAVGAASSSDIPDRSAADGRYAQLGAANSFTGKQTVVASGTALPASTGMAAQTSNTGGLEIQPQGSSGTAGASFMSFHRPGNYAVHFGLDTDNKLKFGGWSMGGNAYEIWHAGNDGAGSGLDADLLDGLQPATGATANSVGQRDSNGALTASSFRTGQGWAEVGSVAGGQGWIASNLYHDGTNWRTRATHGGIGAHGLVLNWPAWGDVSIAEVTGATTAEAIVSPVSRKIWTDSTLPVTVSGQVVDFKTQPTVNGQPLAGGSVTKSAVTVLPAAGTINVTAKSILAVYSQFVGQTFTVDYNTEAQYTQENAATGTDQVGGAFQLYNTAGAQIDSATKVLVKADGVNGSTEIIDERGITPFGTHCGWFDGLSYWKVPSSYKVAFGSAQNFTYECWVRPTNLGSGYKVLFDTWGTSGVGVEVAINGSSIYWWDGTTARTHSTLTDEQWYHVALVRYNGTTTLYVNGVGGASAADTTNYPNKPLGIGAVYNGTSIFNGWLDQLRVSKIARYTGNFTPPTTAFTTDADTAHLFTFDDGHGGQVLKDRANSGRAMFAPTATISTEQAKFGTTSLKMTGATNPCVIGWGSTPQADLAIGSDDFTMDLWFYKTNLNNAALFCAGQNTYSPQIWVDSAVRVYLSSTNSSWDISAGTQLGSVTLNAWNHLALTRSGTTVYAMLNGVLLGSWNVGTTSFVTSGPFQYYGGAWDNSGILAGYIDEVRFKRGEAVWTSSFTPPTGAYTADARTVILLHFDGANGDKVTLDSSGSSYGTNAFGDTTTPALTFQNSASLSASYARGGHSTSLELNGSNQYAMQAFAAPGSGHPVYFGTNTKFCVEGWFYVPTLSGINTYAALVDLRCPSFGIALNVYLLASGQMQANVRQNSGGTNLVINGGNASVGWNHFALVRDGRGYVLYSNGTSGAAPVGVSIDPYYTNDIYKLSLGAWVDGSGGFFTMAFDAIRITNGQPRYTANFTPATLVADDMTTLMWEFNGAVGQKWVKELSQNTALIAANGNARTVKDGRYLPYTAGAKLSTAWSAFGTGSLLFNGTNPGIDLGTGSEWQFSGDFTIDARIRLNATGQYHTIAAKGGAAVAADRAWDFSVSSGNKLQFNVYVGTTIYTATGATSLSSGTSYHVAAVRSGNTLMVFLNGTLDGSVTMSGTMNTSTVAARIGSFWTGASELSISNAYFDEFRISNTARWTASFIPPTIDYGQQYVTGPY